MQGPQFLPARPIAALRRPARLVEGLLGGEQPDHGVPVEGLDFRIGQVRPERRDELVAPGNGRLRAGRHGKGAGVTGIGPLPADEDPGEGGGDVDGLEQGPLHLIAIVQRTAEAAGPCTLLPAALKLTPGLTDHGFRQFVGATPFLHQGEGLSDIRPVGVDENLPFPEQFLEKRPGDLRAHKVSGQMRCLHDR